MTDIGVLRTLYRFATEAIVSWLDDSSKTRRRQAGKENARTLAAVLVAPLLRFDDGATECRLETRGLQSARRVIRAVPSAFGTRILSAESDHDASDQRDCDPEPAL